MGLETDGAILNQMRINKLGLKEITSHRNCLVVHATWVGLAGDHDRQSESQFLFFFLRGYFPHW